MEEKNLSHHESDALGEFIKVIVISLAIILPIRYFLVQPFYVKGASMEPTILDQEYLIIDELSYRFRDPLRGEIVVLRPPQDQSEFFIKRIIGLPGEKIVILNQTVTIVSNQHPEGIKLDEPYLSYMIDPEDKTTMQLGANEYFVMGDNRPHSLDSRRIGPIKKSDIVGRALVRGWPLNRMGIFERPYYQQL